MNLIDADKLKAYIEDCEFCYKCPDKEFRCDITCEMPDYLTNHWNRAIDEQPTVDAVPLEWIKRRIEGLNIQAEKSTDDNKWADFAREAFALEKIVKFWAERKEE